MKKIIITGGLGYIGTELSRLYSSYARNNEVIVLDKKFASSRIKDLRSWGIKYQQCNILDVANLKKIINDADIIHHLAGVTDVAYVKKESSEELDKKIYLNGVKATLNIIKYSSKRAKIIFPSSHVVFEGLSNIKKNINEDEKPLPILAYSKGKLESERDLIKRFRLWFI
jgi:UDP-glucose 4-epimerase